MKILTTPRVLVIGLTLAMVATVPVLAAGSHFGAENQHAKAQPADVAGPNSLVVTELDRFNEPGATKLSERLVLPKMDAARGKKLFVSKGCVACHSVNGVGGQDAPNFDAPAMKKVMSPFDFTAKMWRAAEAMIAVQEEALGEQILFTGAELADIVAFAHDDEVQHSFSEADLTPMARKMMEHGHGDATGMPSHDASSSEPSGHEDTKKSH